MRLSRMISTTRSRVQPPAQPVGGVAGAVLVEAAGEHQPEAHRQHRRHRAPATSPGRARRPRRWPSPTSAPTRGNQPTARPRCSGPGLRARARGSRVRKRRAATRPVSISARRPWLTPAPLKVAISRAPRRRERRIGTASAAPVPSPRRRPRSSTGSEPEHLQQALGARLSRAVRPDQEVLEARFQGQGDQGRGAGDVAVHDHRPAPGGRRPAWPRPWRRTRSRPPRPAPRRDRPGRAGAGPGPSGSPPACAAGPRP